MMQSASNGKKSLDLYSSEEESSHDHEESLVLNKKYASEYQKRKVKEDLINSRHNFHDDSGSDCSSSESEDEDGELLTPVVDLEIMKTINALRNKDESIYNASKKFFELNGGDDDDHGTCEKDTRNGIESKKPKKYKDLIRDQILKSMETGQPGGDHISEDGLTRNDNSIDEEKSDWNENNSSHKLAYDEEQIALRDAFLNIEDEHSTNENDNERTEEMWVPKMKSKGHEEVGRNDTIKKLIDKEILALEASTQSRNHDSNESASNDVLNYSQNGHENNDLSDPKGTIKNGEQFLVDFVKSKKWIDDTNDYNKAIEDAEEYNTNIKDDNDHNSDASLQDLENMDKFESQYNFRFEEAMTNLGSKGTSGASLSVVGYSRNSLSDTIRRKDDTRKIKRQERKSRKEAERKAKEEQLRRLKNAKKEELNEKMKKIKAVLGCDAEEAEKEVDEDLIMKLMEGDYDPDKFDQMMKEAYNDDYYDREDSKWKTDLDVKESMQIAAKEEDIDLLTHDDDGDLYDDNEYIDEDGDDQIYSSEELYNHHQSRGEETIDNEQNDESNSKESKLTKKLKSKMMDELYKLDYEDFIGDMPTRFKYRKVEKNNYGLSTEEILCARDSTLKQFVSLKKMAPYSQEGEYFPGAKRRKRFREINKTETEIQKKEKLLNESECKEESSEGNVVKKKRRRKKKGKKN